MAETISGFIINGHDYTRYVKAKTGIQWENENTNAEDAGRDAAEVMHTNVTSHQRKLTCTLGPMGYAVAYQLARDLIDNDAGVSVTYPDIYDGFPTTKLFYNTSISYAIECFKDGDLVLDNVKFTLITVQE